MKRDLDVCSQDSVSLTKPIYLLSLRWLDDVPGVLGGVTKFAAGYAGAKTVIADTDRLVFEGIREIVFAFGHGAYKDAYAFCGCQAIHVVSDSDHWSIETEGDLTAGCG